jgi:peptidoglycan/xylan/chitin deacetylase (PgdA/CDA1 family)
MGGLQRIAARFQRGILKFVLLAMRSLYQTRKTTILHSLAIACLFLVLHSLGTPVPQHQDAQGTSTDTAKQQVTLSSAPNHHETNATSAIERAQRASIVDQIGRETSSEPQTANANEPQTAPALTCGENALGPGRLITLDTQGGGEYGLVQFRKTLPLNDKEVVFTFDDGPHPTRTLEVLDILDQHCIKAVFFVIGDLAHRHPEIVREIQRRGHVIGTHTWSHSLSLVRFSQAHAEDDISQGFAAVSDALGGPTAPFFRFPGLRQSDALRKYLAEGNIAVWSVDAVSGDSEGASASRLPGRLMSRLEPHGRGVLLFHDIKETTVDALPTIIRQLQKEGYHAAQVVPAKMLMPDPEMIARLHVKTEEASLRHGRGRIR